MSQIHRFSNWFFSSRRTEPSMRVIILWWEIRRIPFNLIVGTLGVISLLLTLMLNRNIIPRGEDTVEPFALLLAPIFLNIAYTAGWIVEGTFGHLWADEGRPAGPRLLKFGLMISVVLVMLPSLSWAIYRLLLAVDSAR